MTTPSAPPPAPSHPDDATCDSVFQYRDRIHRLPDQPASLRTLELDHGDGDVSIYDAAGNFLACEEGRDEALRTAEMIVISYVNDVRWEANELAAGRGHLQRHFPQIAARHGCPPAEAVRPTPM